MKYFRTYPLGLQLLLFILMTFTMLFLAVALIGVLLPNVFGVPATSIQNISDKSEPLFIHLSLLAQGLGSLMIFAGSTFLFTYLAHPSPKKYLGLSAPQKPVHLLLAVLAMLGAMPLFMALQTLMGRIDFGADVKKGQEAAEAVSRAYLLMPTFTDFLRTFVVVAIIPAIGEELLFRGMIMRFAHKASGRMVVAVLFSAAVFAFVHASYYGLPSIFLAGALLAVIYYLTGSLWCGILAHLLFNGSQIILTYMAASHPALSAFLNENTIMLGFVASGTALFAASFYMLWKTRTPLPSNWSNDFRDEQQLPPDEKSAIFN